MHRDDLLAFARRDWQAMAGSRLAFWGERCRRDGSVAGRRDPAPRACVPLVHVASGLPGEEILAMLESTLGQSGLLPAFDAALRRAWRSRRPGLTT